MAAHLSDTRSNGAPAVDPDDTPAAGRYGTPAVDPDAAPAAARYAAPAAGPNGGPVVGFDLDMTLIDSRPGIHACYRALSAETGVAIDADLAVTRLGPPLEQELAHWFPAGRIQEAADRYRELYPEYAIEPALALPGAREAVAAVRELGGRAVVVTAKHEPNAKLHLDHLGIRPDALVGWLWAEAKAEALREHGASVYVGDHTGDVRGARAADACSVAVPTGPCGEEELRTAGADVILADLTRFPAWLRRYASGDGHDRHRADLA
ncbi:haloacid dehalogenase-like hydrolase [Streptomyces sp. HNM0663]|uniref:Haloacid dehalogenase-like hydrolase n=1 Tax=Streptomyces chengmaiensis TaxID=3040919 RepID=A0ABT6HNN2_9ACTN|nr:haloacid dehalogenase-like hydrolase [Streptomyces chengmaiensis]MDH2389649.1 haloacid dehalogenase-like hydrolase [Streptomyces chengmaiensis]